MECNYKFQFDELQGHLRAQRRPSCKRQHHLRGTGHCPAREVSTSNPHNESIKNAHLEKSRWAFCIPKTTRWASGSKEVAADEAK